MIDNSILKTGPYAYLNFKQVFEKHILKTEYCHVWVGSLYPNGYGNFKFRNKDYLAHRAAYELHHGVELTRKDVVCHTCDNRACVNPDHLVCADQKFNMQDAKRKGRMNTACGEDAGKSKLTDKDVLAIRKLRWISKMPVKQIAKMFQMSGKQISVVSRGVQWGHIKSIKGI